MRARTTLLLLLGAAFLTGAILYWENRAPRGDALQLEASALPVLELAAIDRIGVSGPRGSVMLARGSDGVWRMKEPVADRPDKELLEGLFQALSQLASRRYLSPVELKEAAQDEADFGLVPAERLELDLFAGDEQAAAYWIGRSAPFENSVYLKREGEENGVHIANVDLRTLLDLPLERFRDNHVLRVVPEAVERLSIERAGSSTEFRRAGRDNPQWLFVKPLQTRAAVERVEEILAELGELRAAEFVEESESQGVETAETDALVRIWYAGTEEPVETLRVLPRGALGDQGPLVLCAGREGAFRVDAAALELLTFSTEDLRDRRLARFSPGAVSALTLRPLGLPVIRVERRGPLWFFAEPSVLAGEPANGETAESVLRALGEAEIVRFESDSALDLAKFGLEPPLFSITLEGESFSAYGSPPDDAQTTLLLSGEFSGSAAGAAPGSNGSREAAQEGDTGVDGDPEGAEEGDVPPPAPPVPGAAELAASEASAGPFLVRAHFKGEPFVFAVDAGLKAAIPALVVKWRDPAVLQFTFTTLRRVEIQSPSGLLRAAYDPARDVWTAEDGSGADLSARVDVQKAQRLAATLGTLNAHSWMGDRAEALGMLANPVLEIRLEREAPGEDGRASSVVRHVLRFAPNDDGAVESRFYYGQLDGAPDVFLIGEDVVRLLAESVLKSAGEEN